MKHGFIKVAAATPKIKVADCAFNTESILTQMTECFENDAKIIVFPELCLTGYTSSDLFYQDTLLNAALNGLFELVKASRGHDALIFAGLPLRKNGRLYNAAAVFANGVILGFVPKTFLPNYNEFYEKRQFGGAPEDNSVINVAGSVYPFGKRLLFCCDELPELKVAAEICEDLWIMDSPSVSHAEAGASVIVNLSASSEFVGKANYRRQLVSGQSAKLVSGYIYCDAGDGESTTDIIFAGHNIIAENGRILKESVLFENGIIYSEIDIKCIAFERSKIANYDKPDSGYISIPFSLKPCETVLTRLYPKFPFVPAEDAELSERAELILNLQSRALKKRIEHTDAKTLVIGVSGGLDSALALMVAVRTAKLAKKDVKSVIGITMPCFGTTQRTKSNSEKLAVALGITFETIDISNAVSEHLKNISHDGAANTAYENAQARERTQILMDKANLTGGLVVGTGDLSELALGWSTYNGDHMSMYGVNSGVPKTLVKYLIRYEADRLGGEIKDILYDILNTPISPELLPPKDGKIAQKTEDIIGPYALHDYFLYYFIRTGFSPSKVLRLAEKSFEDEYTEAEIKKWLTLFIKRFFSQQFKRSCLPDGIKIGSVALSPRGDWKMPSDASASAWLKELEENS